MCVAHMYTCHPHMNLQQGPESLQQQVGYHQQPDWRGSTVRVTCRDVSSTAYNRIVAFMRSTPGRKPTISPSQCHRCVQQACSFKGCHVIVDSHRREAGNECVRARRRSTLA